MGDENTHPLYVHIWRVEFLLMSANPQHENPQPKWLTELAAAMPEAAARILRGDPPPCGHRYCHRQGYAMCMGAAGAQMDMLEDAGWSEREAFLKVAAGIFGH